MTGTSALNVLLCECCCFVIFTDVDEVGPVLASHAETKIPPEARVFLDHLQGGAWDLQTSTHTAGPVDWAAGATKYFTVSPPHTWLAGKEKSKRWIWLLPVAAPRAGCAQDFHRSEWGCTGWIRRGRRPSYLQRHSTYQPIYWPFDGKVANFCNISKWPLCGALVWFHHNFLQFSFLYSSSFSCLYINVQLIGCCDFCFL